MLICRLISIFLLLCSLTPSLLTKNISQDNIDTVTKEVLQPESLLQISAELESCDLMSDTEYTLVDSDETYIGSNTSMNNISFLEDDRYGYIIEMFIHEMEGFWQEVKLNLLKQKLNTLTPDKDFEDKYEAMKNKFFKEIPENLPQNIIDVISEYEKRYNILMLSEIMNDQSMKIEGRTKQNNSDALFKAQPKSMEPTNKQQNEDIKGSIKIDKCTKRSFEDFLKSKTTKAKRFSDMNNGF